MRYQFLPRANHPTIDLSKADAAAHKAGCSYIRESYPKMPKGGGKGYWIGTNQPRTVSFTALDDEQAKEAQDRYGDDFAFVWNIDLQRYI